MRRLLAGFTVLAVASASGHPSSALFAAPADAVHVRASAAFAACLAPALDAFTRSTGVAVTLTTADPDPPQDADLVVGDDLEMTQLLEGGATDSASAVDLGQVPWVLVVPSGSPAGLSALAAGPVSVLAGGAGRDARASLNVGAGGLELTNDASALRRASRALVPRSLAGAGERRPSDVRPLIATAALVAGSPRAAAARRLLVFLSGDDGRQALGGCFDPMPKAPLGAASTAGPAGTRAVSYAQAVVDWWLPQCSLARNRYNDTGEVLGPPDAVNLGGVENYLGFMSLGQGGYVTVDVGTFADGPGPDVRVFQTVSGAGEPVSLYASNNPQGPFTRVGLRVPCGERSPGLFSNHCDFDLAAGGVSSARYLKVEDGEIYPCLNAGSVTEGADIDAVEILSGAR
jgi:hypothetical protein